MTDEEAMEDLNILGQKMSEITEYIQMLSLYIENKAGDNTKSEEALVALSQARSEFMSIEQRMRALIEQLKVAP
jgi:hypothetical protein